MSAPHSHAGLTVDAAPRRKEDERLLLGRACFTDDVHLDRMVHGVFVRSPMAHARIVRIDASAAIAAGALLVLTAEDLPFIDRDFVLRYANPHIRGGLPTFLARGRVRFVGEPVAFLVAPDRYVAEDLAALVDVEYESLPAVGSVAAAQQADAPVLHDSWVGNVAAAFTRTRGEPLSVMQAAPHRLKRRFGFGRQVPLPLETRGCVADFDRAAGKLCVWSSIQTHYALRQNLASLLDMPEPSVRVVACDVGGGFGSKSRPYVEDVVVSHASRVLGQPVKWIEDRFEHLQATTHSRAIDTELELGFDDQGRILAMNARLVADIGAYVFTSGIITAEVAASVMAGPYRIDHLQVDVCCVGTNKTPLATFRGAGQPEATLAVECMMDLVARQLGMDALELRRRNVVRPVDLPVAAWIPIGDAVGEIESGDYPQMLERLAQHSGYQETTQKNADGETLAWGLACGFELTGFINFESAKVRVGTDGKVTVWSGMSSQGQGQYSTYATVCAEALGVDVDEVTVCLGDTDMLPFGRGAFGSRGAVVGANAVAGAAALVLQKILALAGTMLDAAPDSLEMRNAQVYRRGGAATGLTLAAIAQSCAPGGRHFNGEPALEAQFVFDTQNKLTFALAVHAAQVAVQPATGFVRVVDYYVVHDAGREMNAMVVEGQVVGGVAEGIGGALLAEIVHDADAQLQTGTLADYLVATAPEIPRIRLDHVRTVPTTNPLGVRGVGECGVIAVAPALINAVARAIDPAGTSFQQPLFQVPVRPGAVRQAYADHAGGDPGARE
ncbi:MAG: xanthine dehydrogenase family protein molybdopterin-binding subunit [Burkholderiaceae bacterium]|nr:xanthine dehydrogenase family protein molybdopterin-binding subunit [Burkholderiaceae bacterium]MDO9090141.1 xanthine dehydrogenase family protein molybdopterin-binding subunit [Burkholderiaceae bacterium]